MYTSVASRCCLENKKKNHQHHCIKGPQSQSHSHSLFIHNHVLITSRIHADPEKVGKGEILHLLCFLLLCQHLVFLCQFM